MGDSMRGIVVYDPAFPCKSMTAGAEVVAIPTVPHKRRSC